MLEKRALVLDDEAAAPRDAAPGRRDVGREGRGSDPRRAGLRARARRAIRRTRSRPSGSRRSTAQQYKWTELVEILLERSEIVDRRRAADPDPQRGRQDLRDRDRRSGERVLRAAGRVQARLLARPDRERARAPRHGDRTAGRSCSTSTPTASTSSSARIAARPPTCGSKIGRWYGEHLVAPRVRDPLGAAGAAHRSRAHRRARRRSPTCSASAAAGAS